jgi:cytochrome P450
VIGIELIAAGVDTTSNASDWLLWYMAQHPETQERLATRIREVVGPIKGVPLTAEHLAELKMNSYMDEVFRLHPVIPLGNRLFNDDAELFGYKVPAKTSIHLNLWAAAKDSRNYKGTKLYYILC